MGKRLDKRLNHSLGKAVHDWGMIDAGDRILLGVSGGKDSLSLFYLLLSLKKKAPISFDIVPVHIDPGFDGSFAPLLKTYCQNVSQSLCRELHVESTDYGILAHSSKNSGNPCFLCSRLRRKRLFELAKAFGCKKVALGHNKDDLIETLFINMFYAGKIGTMKPRQSFFNGALDIIRPLSYVEADDLRRLSQNLEMPVFDNPCPSAGQTQRETVRRMLRDLYRQNRHIKGNIFRALGNVSREYLLEAQHD